MDVGTEKKTGWAPTAVYNSGSGGASFEPDTILFSCCSGIGFTRGAEFFVRLATLSPLAEFLFCRRPFHMFSHVAGIEPSFSPSPFLASHSPHRDDHKADLWKRNEDERDRLSGRPLLVRRKRLALARKSNLAWWVKAEAREPVGLMCMLVGRSGTDLERLYSSVVI
jgi:hypothetical protein